MSSIAPLVYPRYALNWNMNSEMYSISPPHVVTLSKSFRSLGMRASGLKTSAVYCSTMYEKITASHPISTLCYHAEIYESCFSKATKGLHDATCPEV
eukprot:1295228-Amphidinium_carterae.1